MDKTLKINSTKRAFTLAEVLITLGIIGVVAALTLPTLINNATRAEMETRLVKTYSTLVQAIQSSEVDNGPFKQWPSGMDIRNMTTEAYFDKYYRPYFNIQQTCINGMACGYEENAPWAAFNGTPAYVGTSASDGTFYFRLMDGTFIYIRAVVTDSEGNLLTQNALYVDLNGPKKPNVQGKDLFVFEFDQDKTISAYGGGWSDSSVESSCASTGMACAEQIRRAGWQMDDDYPWQ